MASQFDTDFATLGLPSLLQRAGQSITYDPAVGADVALTAVIVGEKVTEESDRLGTVKVRMQQVIICVDPASDFGGVAAPALNDRVTISSESWSVKGILRLSGAFAKLDLVRPQRVEVARDSHRSRT